MAAPAGAVQGWHARVASGRRLAPGAAGLARLAGGSAGGMFAPVPPACKCLWGAGRAAGAGVSPRGRALLGVLAVAGCLGAGAVAVSRVATAQGGSSAGDYQLEWAKGVSKGCALPGACSGPLSDQGAPIAQSSPMLANLAGVPSVVVGDRSGYLYAYGLSNGSPVPGWPVDVGAPIDSTPSVAVLSGTSSDSVFVGAGNAAHPDVGGYYAFGPGGNQLWHSAVLHLGHAAVGVQASLTVANLQGTTAVSAGSLGQLSYALDATSGQTLPGFWPFFSADSVFSTAAAADLYGDGQDELVVGGASTAGLALGRAYAQGGHLRVLNAEGQLLYDYHTTQEVDSSPAVGNFLAGGQPGIVVGTGSYFKGASDTDTVKAFDTRLGLVWSDTLDGVTSSSPALADVQGNGQLDVVEGTDTGSGGSVWVLDGANGQTVCHTSVIGRVIGSVVTADLSGGSEDLLVPTTQGVEVVDGQTCSEVTVLGAHLGFQNAPLVTDDPNGEAGITIAGYNGANKGVILHYEVTGSNGATAVGPGTWPMFHHDPSLSGTSAPLPDTGTVTPSSVSAVAGNSEVSLSWGAPPAGSGAAPTGYDVYEGTTPGQMSAQPVNGASPVSGQAYTVTGLTNGTRYYFEVTALNSSGEGAPVVATGVPFGPPGAPAALAATAGDGEVSLSWRAPASNGSVITGYNVYESTTPGAEGPKVATTTGTNYTVTGLSDGTNYYFEVTAVNAAGEGPASSQVVAVPVGPSTPTTSPSAPPTTAAPPPSAPTSTTTTLPPPSAMPAGYRLVTAGGQVSAFGKVPSAKTGRPAAPVAGVASTRTGKGYWLAESDGGVLAAGDAHLYGSLTNKHLNKPIVGIASTPDGKGYWLVASDGGIFAFGDARYYGSLAGKHLVQPVVGIAP